LHFDGIEAFRSGGSGLRHPTRQAGGAGAPAIAPDLEAAINRGDRSGSPASTAKSGPRMGGHKRLIPLLCGFGPLGNCIAVGLMLPGVASARPGD